MRVLTGRRQGRLRGRGVVRTEAEAAGKCFQGEGEATSGGTPPGARKAGNRSSPAAYGRSIALPTP